MKIVIDIDENVFTRLFDNGTEDYAIVNDDLFSIAKAIRNGAVLPKGHGDLIDRDKLEKDTEWNEYEDGFISYSHLQIFGEPVVIPADKGELDNEDSN